MKNQQLCLLLLKISVAEICTVSGTHSTVWSLNTVGNNSKMDLAAKNNTEKVILIRFKKKAKWDLS